MIISKANIYVKPLKPGQYVVSFDKMITPTFSPDFPQEIREYKMDLRQTLLDNALKDLILQQADKIAQSL